MAIDTTNILFILSGAFVGIDRIVKDRKVGDNVSVPNNSIYTDIIT